MSLQTMMSDFEIFGLWSVPGQEDVELPGHLFCSSGGYRLELLGVFPQLDEVEPGEVRRADAVIGLSDTGEKVTLFNVMQIHSNFDNPGLEKSVLVAELMLLGQHYTSIDQLVAKKVSLSFSYLEEWLGVLTPFTQEPMVGAERGNRFTITYGLAPFPLTP